MECQLSRTMRNGVRNDWSACTAGQAFVLRDVQ